MDVIRKLEVLSRIDHLYRRAGSGLAISKAIKATDDELIQELKRARKEDRIWYQ